MTCVVLGDSIAVGTGAAIPACHTVARVGISSPTYAAVNTLTMDASLAVISLGSNDGTWNTADSLELVRSRIHADRVVWLLPAVGAREFVREIAVRHSDQIVDILPYVGRDGVHPFSYETIARQITKGG